MVFTCRLVHNMKERLIVWVNKFIMNERLMKTYSHTGAKITKVVADGNWRDKKKKTKSEQRSHVWCLFPKLHLKSKIVTRNKVSRNAFNTMLFQCVGQNSTKNIRTVDCCYCFNLNVEVWPSRIVQNFRGVSNFITKYAPILTRHKKLISKQVFNKCD